VSNGGLSCILCGETIKEEARERCESGEKTCVEDSSEPSSRQMRSTSGVSRKVEASRGALQLTITTYYINPLIDGRGAVRLMRGSIGRG
jgi:hypothetical protein